MENDPRTFAVIGAAIEVHRQLGNDFLEAVYQEALGIELERRSIAFRREAELAIPYNDRRLHCSYRADFVCFDEVIVELKALRQLSGSEEAQVINYLKATGFRTGLLLNFGAPRLEYKRFVHSSNAVHLRPEMKLLPLVKNGRKWASAVNGVSCSSTSGGAAGAAPSGRLPHVARTKYRSKRHTSRHALRLVSLATP